MKLFNLIRAVSFALLASVIHTAGIVAQEVAQDSIIGVWYKTHSDEPLFVTKKSNDTLRVTFLSSSYIDLPRDTLKVASYRYTKINPNARSGRTRTRRYAITARGKDTLELLMEDVIYFAHRKKCQ